MKNQDKPAGALFDPNNCYDTGLTKYEEFMKVAMGALISNSDPEFRNETAEDVADSAHEYVKAMFKQMDEHNKQEG